MPPILTGEHPPSGSADINAPVRTIVKCQASYTALYDDSVSRLDGVGHRAAIDIVERCPQLSYVRTSVRHAVPLDFAYVLQYSKCSRRGPSAARLSPIA